MNGSKHSVKIEGARWISTRPRRGKRSHFGLAPGRKTLTRDVARAYRAIAAGNLGHKGAGKHLNVNRRLGSRPWWLQMVPGPEHPELTAHAYERSLC